MDWNNVDLDSPSESAAYILDPYTFDDLLLEVSCNLREITPETVKAQAMLSIISKYEEAIDILNSNLANITAKAIEYRDTP